MTDFIANNLSEIAVKTVTNFLSKHQEIEKVVFCCFDEGNYGIAEGLIKTLDV